MSSPGSLDAARQAWQALPEPVRREVAGTIAPAELEARAHQRLARIVARRLPGQHPPAVGEERLHDLLIEACSPLFGDSLAFARAYAVRLLALALPLVGEEPPLEPRRIRELIERAGSHEVLGPAALEASLDQLADEFVDRVGHELATKLAAMPGSPAPVGETGWLDRADRLLLSVDHVTMSCARYLAGLQLPAQDRYGYDELDAGRSSRSKRVDKVTVRFEPAPAAGAGLQEPPGSELKAKLFVALFALAAEARGRGDRSGGRVRLRDLLWMMGFELGSHTNSGYYWRYAAQLTRYLLIDLPNRVVAMQLALAGDPQPRIVFEPLLARARPLAADGSELDPAPIMEALRGEPDDAAREIRRLGVHGFDFSVSDELLEAHGIGRPLNAIEHVPVQVLALRGPAFWLAWQVAFLRRWAPLPQSGAHGKPLLRSLSEAGHLAAATRGSRVRYKDALTSWWRDAGELAAVGLLDEPGVRLYGSRGGRWREVSTEVSRWLDPGSGRVTRARLQEVRVVFQIPAVRSAQLEAVRRRKARRPGIPGAGRVR